MQRKLFWAFVCLCFPFLLMAGRRGFAQQVIHVPADQRTIQAGIDAAQNGDTVLVAPGTYYENIVFKGKAITVTSSDGAAKTVIDGDAGKDAAVKFVNEEGAGSVLNGFTVQNGGTLLNRGLESSPLSGIYISQGQPVISNNILTHNRCHSIYSSFSSPLILNNEIDNTETGSNVCGFAGGTAIWLYGSLNYFNAGTPTGLPAIVRGNLIQNNTESGTDDAGGNGGVGVAVWGANALIERNTIRNNKTLGEGAIYAFNTVAVRVIGNLIYNNTAVSTSAGIDLEPPDATVGPFIGIIEGNTVYGNVLATSNSDLGSAGTQIRLSGNLGQYALVNNVIVGNSSTIPAVSCGESYNYLSITPLVFDHNDIYNGGSAAYGGACPDQTGIYGNLSADPQFVDAAAGDFHVRASSPAVDTGNTSAPNLLSIGLAGETRVQDATGLGHPVVDMGAYELGGALDAAPTILTLTPSTYFPYDLTNNPFVLTATLTSLAGIPTGPVTFYEDLKAVGTVTADRTGKATLTPQVTPGVHAFLATYPGQGAFPSAVSVKFYVLFPKATPVITLSSSSNPSVVGTDVTFSVHVSSSDGSIPSPITVTDSTTKTILATLTPDGSGAASFHTAALALGLHQLSAAFAGNDTDTAASVYLFQTVVNAIPTIVALSSTPNPSSYLQNVTFRVGVSASIASSQTPAGTITFLDGSQTIGSATYSGSGQTTFSTSSLTAGTHQITAQFTPNSTSFAPSSAQLAQVVQGIASATSLSVSPLTGTSTDTYTMVAKVTDSAGASAAGAPTGAVLFSFNSGASTITIPLTNGIASYQATGLSAGANTVTATYQGDSVYSRSTSNPVVLTVSKAVTALSLIASANPAVALSATTFTAHLTGSGGQQLPAGAVVQISFGTGQVYVMQTNLQGLATYSATGLLPGTYTVTATFVGNNGLLASSASLTETVLGIPTSAGLSAAPNPAYLGQNVSLTATTEASGGQIPSGTVTFYDGAVVLGTAPLAGTGQAVLTTNSLPAGTHSLTVSFAAGGAFLASGSPAVQETILPSSFSIALTPASVNLRAGQPGTVVISLKSIGSFAGPLTLSLGAMPAYGSGAFKPNQVMLTAGGDGSAALVLQTSQVAMSAEPARPGQRIWPVAFTALIFLPFWGFRNRRMRGVLLFLVTGAVLSGLTGCGLVGVPFHTVAAGSYQVPVLATDSVGTQKTAMLNVTITP